MSDDTRDRVIVVRYQAGATAKFLADRYALSSQRVSQILIAAGIRSRRNVRHSDWTDDQISTLRRMWAAGDMTRQIADVLGLTRNAVIGKANRLKLKPRPSPIIRQKKRAA